MSFRLVQHDTRAASPQARTALVSAKLPKRLKDHRAAAADYRIDETLETAINMALAVGEPLLVTGEPGTGKTQLAWYLGAYFDIKVRSFHVKSTSTATDLKYDFDAVGYLQSAYLVQQGGDASERSEFLQEGPLWEAYNDPNPSVLLIDEIDKAPRDFPNDLLHELDQTWFPHPFKRENGQPQRIEPKANRPPIVVITSNIERRLPGPFLRRCIFHHIELNEDLVQRIVDSRSDLLRKALSPELQKLALERFWELRERQLAKPPSTAELLLWLAILGAQGTSESLLQGPLAKLPALGALIKDQNDRQQL